MQKTITRLVLAITSKETLETVERWQFDIITEDENGTGESSGSGKFCLPERLEACRLVLTRDTTPRTHI